MLYPIRVDVISNDGKTRLIDSILMDPSCLPIPLCPITNVEKNGLLDQTIERNSKHLATTLIADMEVHSCSRAHRTGRIALFQTYPELETKIEDQISSQLRIILEQEHYFNKKRKRKLDVSDDKEENINDEGKEQKNEKEAATSINKEGNLVKVNIRLRIDEISIVDEFWVDPNHPMSNPLFLAESIANDLNLPKSAINTIALSIAEQICGLEVSENVDGLLRYDDTAKAKSNDILMSNNVDKGVSSAWMMVAKEIDVASLHFKSEVE